MIYLKAIGTSDCSILLREYNWQSIPCLIPLVALDVLVVMVCGVGFLIAFNSTGWPSFLNETFNSCKSNVMGENSFIQSSLNTMTVEPRSRTFKFASKGFPFIRQVKLGQVAMLVINSPLVAATLRGGVSITQQSTTCTTDGSMKLEVAPLSINMVNVIDPALPLTFSVLWGVGFNRAWTYFTVSSSSSAPGVTS
ncbi:hypothetical protein Dimus_039744 [Dionaea muscipula]